MSASDVLRCRRRATHLQLGESFLQSELHVRVMQKLLCKGAASLLFGQPGRIKLRRTLDHRSNLEVFRQPLR